MAFDLTLDEARRRSAVLEALDDDWDPLYSDIDHEQQRVYDELVGAGVLRVSGMPTLQARPCLR